MNEHFLYKQLDTLKEWGNLKEVPQIIERGLSEKIYLREYQKEAFQYFVSYFENEKLRKSKQFHTLFHMATGSGKTIIMAGLILYLFTKGYNNFIFFVDQTNIIEKTKENFFNELSNKYLFNKELDYLEEKIKIKMVNNFRSSFLKDNSINIYFTTTQKLHNDLFGNKENSINRTDFEENKVVFISDESHHMNASTKSKKEKEKKEKENETWETSVMNTFYSNRDSLLLEFTATLDLKDENIKNKYVDKIIFNYPLKNFRDSLYTKEFENITTAADPWTRTLIALILSEYRKYLFADLKLNMKPVLLLKSENITASAKFYEEFLERIKTLNVEDLEKISKETNIKILQKAFQYFKGKNEDLTFLVHSIKDSFREENLLFINSKTIPKGMQLLVNSLEDEGNPIRAVFAVDMLNEGWDVLNLYDIVRLYENRGDSYTTKEAQLIGRAARYCPFKLNDEQEKFKRKYDEDVENTYRVLETMYFHSKNDSKYISELRQVLINIGMQDPKEKFKREYRLKESFKEQPIYKNGLIYLNERIEKDRKNICGVDDKIKNETYSYLLQSTRGKNTNLLEKDEEKFQKEVQDSPTNIAIKKLSEIDYHILLGASECFSELKFSIIKQKFPNLKSMREFLLSSAYLGDIRIEFYSHNLLTELKGKDYFEAAKKVFRKIASYIVSIKPEYEGTKIFIPHKIKEIIKDKSIYLSEVKENGGKGESQILTSNQDLKLNLELEPWYIFNDNYGTNEEKAFIKYFKTDIAPKLDKKELEYYVIRNEREFAIYSFSNGSRFEPDYLLFIRKKKIDDNMDYQVFIEPKGEQLLEQDSWKEIFLEKIEENAKLKRNKSKNLELIESKNHFLIGLPFFNRNFRKKEFKEAIENFLDKI